MSGKVNVVAAGAPLGGGLQIAVMAVLIVLKAAALDLLWLPETTRFLARPQIS